MTEPQVQATTGPPTSADIARQWVVLISAIAGTLVAFLGSGAVTGTPVNQVADGALATDATLVAPAGPAFAIWSIIYTGLLWLAILQLTPARRADPRQRRVGWWIAASALINAAWVLVVQAEWLWASVAVIVALLVVLVVVLVRLNERPPTSRAEAIAVDGTMGLYLGWVCIATVANTAAALVFSGWAATGSTATTWAVAILGVAAGVGVLLAIGLRGRIAPAIALAWGLSWVAVARTDEPTSTAAALMAGLAAVITLFSAVLYRALARGPFAAS